MCYVVIILLLIAVNEVLEEIKNLLSGVVDVGNIITLLDNLVNNFVAIGQTASLHNFCCLFFIYIFIQTYYL